MGTNYYMIEKSVLKKEKEIQDIADATLSQMKKFGLSQTLENLESAFAKFIGDNKIHLGKFSCGWRFSFAQDNFSGMKDLCAKFNSDTHIIQDEYQRELSLSEMLDIIVSSSESPHRDHNGVPESNSDFNKNKCFKLNDEDFYLVPGEFS